MDPFRVFDFKIEKEILSSVSFLKMYFIGIEINLTFSTSDCIVLTCMLQQLIQPNQLPALVEVSEQQCPSDLPHLVIQTLNMVDHVASRPTAPSVDSITKTRVLPQSTAGWPWPPRTPTCASGDARGAP